jgi:thiol-disulfide isomerase/thioredoxin
MKSVTSLVLLICCASVVVGQSITDRVDLSPAQPQQGGTISVVYHTAAAPTSFAHLKELTLDAYFVPRGSFSEGNFRQVSMTKHGDDWTSSVVIEDPWTCMVLFRFVAGDSVDDNNDNVWGSMVWDGNGRPVESAHLAMSELYHYGIASFKRQTDNELMRKELNEERVRYPDNWNAATSLWNMQLGREASDSVEAVILPVLNMFYEKNKADDSLVALYPSWYERLGDTAKAREIRAAGIARAPRGKVALESRSGELHNVSDPAQLLELHRKILLDFPNLSQDEYQARVAMALRAAIQAKNFNAAVDLLLNMPKPTYNNYLQVASKLVANDVRLEDAERFAKKAAEMAASPDTHDRKYFKTAKDWKESAEYDRSSCLQIYAQVLSKTGKNNAAEPVAAEAYRLSQGEDSDIGQLYVQTLAADKEYRKAMEIGCAIVKKGKGTDSLLADLKNSFAAQEKTSSFAALSPGKQKEFDEMIANARSAMVAAMRKKVLESRISNPSVDFTLNDLEGTPFRFSSLKGKVVVLDFWATWCNPCRMSFPFLKKVYEKYRANPSVAFVTVDTWERQKDYASTVENTKKFQHDNKYEWTVLIDGKNDVVGRYNVDGIPTKFVIGKDGTIAFKSIGFSGPDMEEELTQQIEILLAESGGDRK